MPSGLRNIPRTSVNKANQASGSNNNNIYNIYNNIRDTFNQPAGKSPGWNRRDTPEQSHSKGRWESFPRLYESVGKVEEAINLFITVASINIKYHIQQSRKIKK